MSPVSDQSTHTHIACVRRLREILCQILDTTQLDRPLYGRSSSTRTSKLAHLILQGLSRPMPPHSNNPAQGLRKMK